MIDVPRPQPGAPFPAPPPCVFEKVDAVLNRLGPSGFGPGIVIATAFTAAAQLARLAGISPDIETTIKAVMSALLFDEAEQTRGHPAWLYLEVTAQILGIESARRSGDP